MRRATLVTTLLVAFLVLGIPQAEARKCFFIFRCPDEVPSTPDDDRVVTTVIYDAVEGRDILGEIPRDRYIGPVVLDDEANTFAQRQTFQGGATVGGSLNLGSPGVVVLAYNATSGRYEVAGVDLQMNLNQVFGTNKGITLKANDPTTGQIRRLITLQAQSPYDRPAVTWTDKNSRNQASLYWHDLNFGDGARHHQLEVKTSADPNGTTPQAMLTRFTLDTDTDLATAGFAYSDTIELQQDYRIQHPMGLVYRMDKDPAGSSSTKLMELKAQVDPSNNTIVNLDPFTINPGEGTGYVRLFRSTNAPNAKLIAYRGDGTATSTFTLDATTGSLTQVANITATGTLTNTGNVVINGDIQRVGALNVVGSTATMRFRVPYVGVDTTLGTMKTSLGSSEETLLGIDPLSADPTKGANIRLFRETNTIGSKSFTIFRGDGTNAETFKVDAGRGDITRVANITATGNLTAGPLTKLINAFGSLGIKANLQGSTSTDLVFYPPGLNKRIRLEFWDRPENETPVYRPLSIETHGPADPNSQEHHVSFYSHNGTSFQAKTFEWHWGPDWDDRVKVYPNLHLLKQLWVNGTMRSIRNNSQTEPTSYPSAILAQNSDQTPGNGITIGFTGADTLGTEREFAGIRGHFVDHSSSSIDGEMSFWLSLGNTRREVAHVNATTWSFNKTVATPNARVASVIAESATVHAVAFTQPEPDVGYGVTCTPNWGTTTWVTTKTEAGYTVNFGTAAPPGATVDCLTFR